MIVEALSLGDYWKFMEAVRLKTNSTNDRKMKLSLLTLAPVNFLHREISEYFVVFEYNESQTIELKVTSGLTDGDKAHVINF